jgi:hypothetical protein
MKWSLSTARYFLGVNLECVSCHDGQGHLNKINLWLSHARRPQLWTQAVFFSKLSIRRPCGIGNEYELLENGGHYDVAARSMRRMPRYATDLTPQFLLTGEKPKDGERWREAYARLLTDNPQFARATVNLIWAELVGAEIWIRRSILIWPGSLTQPAMGHPAEPPGDARSASKRLSRT